MRVHHGIVFTVLAAGACSGDTIPEPEPANFAELCGEVGPVQILALDPDRPLARVASWGTYEGRRVFHVGYLGEGASIAGYPPLGEWETWSVGPCGEDPLLLASGDYLPVYYHQVTADFLPGWPDMPLLCDEATGQISVVDPSGVRPSNVVFETGDCEWRELDDGMLTLVPQDEESAALVLQLWPDDPWTMNR